MVHRVNNHLAFSGEKAIENGSVVSDFDEIVTVGCGEEIPEASTTGDKFWIPDGPHEYQRFVGAVDYTVCAIRDNESVIVHCRNGISRSTGIAATVLATTDGVTLQQAFEEIKQLNPDADPTGPIRESMEEYTGDLLNDYRR